MKTNNIFGLFNKNKNTKDQTLENTSIETSVEETISDDLIKEEEIYEECVHCSGVNLDKLLDSYDETYVPELIFEDKNNPFNMIADKNSERARMASWINITCGNTYNAYSISLMKHNKAIENEKKNAAATEREPDEIPPLAIEAKCFIFVSSDNLIAWLFLIPPVGKGKDISMEEIELALNQSKVSYAIDTDYINSLISEKKYFCTYPISIGKTPVNGEDGFLTDYYPRETLKFVPNSNGIIDYRVIDEFMPIFDGDTICEITEPTDGFDGFDVTGKKLPFKAGKRAKVPRGRNTRVNDEGTALISTIDGDVVFSKGAFSVRNVYNISGDVDYSTGNINFMGDVVISGDVRDNFIVRATGNVIVKGVLESGIIDAEGDVVIMGGILGNEHGTIRSRGNVSAQFMESCKVYSAGTITTDYIIRSDIHCDGPILAVSGKASILGGSISAHSYIETKILGRPNGPHRSTVLTLGAEPCNGGDEIHTMNFLTAFKQEGTDLTLEDLEELREYVDTAEDFGEESASVSSESLDTNVYSESRGSFNTINIGVCIKFSNETLDVIAPNSGLVRFNKKEEKIVIGM